MKANIEGTALELGSSQMVISQVLAQCLYLVKMHTYMVTTYHHTKLAVNPPLDGSGFMHKHQRQMMVQIKNTHIQDNGACTHRELRDGTHDAYW